MTQIDEYSLSTVPVEQFFNETSLGKATSFIWERRNAFYLITNWHVVTCRNNNTGQHLHPQCAEPDRLRGLFCTRARTWDKLTRDIPLRDKDGRPRWLRHAVHRQSVDVVAVPMEAPDNEVGFHPINKIRHEPLLIRIGMDVFVLGYPFGAPPPSLPVWKRGSIASEPELASLTQNYFLIDTASRPGMSGAPVIRRSWGSHLVESGVSIANSPATKFLGVYSGRLVTTDPLDAQLGILWPEYLITEIIDAGVIDALD